jgi:hypothetical protein
MSWMAEELEFNSWQSEEIFLFSTMSRLALGPTQPPSQWVLGPLSKGAKWLGHEADHSSPSNADVNNEWRYTFSSSYFFVAWCLIK